MHHDLVRVEQANSIVRVLTAAYPVFPFNDDTSALYLEALSGRDGDAALAAARTWVMTQPRFPAISDLLAAITRETRRLAPPIPALQEPERPRMTIEQLQAMRPPNLRSKGTTHGHATHRARRNQADRP